MGLGLSRFAMLERRAFVAGRQRDSVFTGRLQVDVRREFDAVAQTARIRVPVPEAGLIRT